MIDYPTLEKEFKTWEENVFIPYYPHLADTDIGRKDQVAISKYFLPFIMKRPAFKEYAQTNPAKASDVALTLLRSAAAKYHKWLQSHKSGINETNTMNRNQLKSLIRHILTEVMESTEPSIGGSFGDQQTNIGGNVRMERDPLNDPMLKEGPQSIDEFVLSWINEIAGSTGLDVDRDYTIGGDHLMKLKRYVEAYDPAPEMGCRYGPTGRRGDPQ